MDKKYDDSIFLGLSWIPSFFSGTLIYQPGYVWLDVMGQKSEFLNGS